MSSAWKAAAEPAALPAQVALWLLGWLALVGASLLARPLFAIDETRYAGVAWEMWQRGEFLVPLLNGAAYSHKPPLLFWLIHAGWAGFGVNALSPRLVPALFGLASVLLTWRIGRRLWPQRPGVGPLAATVLSGSLLWGFYTPALMFDLVLSFWVLLALWGLLQAAGGRGAVGWLLTGAALGLGILTKGPVMLLYALPPALLAPLWLPDLRRPRWFAGLSAALAGGAAIALAWALPAAAAGGPDYARAIFWSQSADRLVDAFAHRRALWWYLPLLPLLLFPWLCWPALWRNLWRLRRRADAPTGLLGAWLLGVFAVFCLISGKQAHYLLPLFPLAALLGARALDGAEAVGGARQWPLAVALAAAAAGMLALRYLELPAHWAALQAGLSPLSALALGLLALATLFPRRPLALARRAVLLAAVSIAAQAVLALGVLGAASPYYDLRPVAARLAQWQAAGVPIAHAGEHHGRFHFAGRVRQPIPELDGQALVVWARQHPHGRIIAYHRGQVPASRSPPLLRRPFRSRVLVLWPAAAWRQGPPGAAARADPGPDR